MRPRDAATGFEIESQQGQSINNVGGDQTYYYGDRASRAGKLIAALGLTLSFGGLAVLVSVAVMTTQNVLDAVNGESADAPYTQYLASGWQAAVGLLVGGIVLKRYGRILAGR